MSSEAQSEGRALPSYSHWGTQYPAVLAEPNNVGGQEFCAGANASYPPAGGVFGWADESCSFKAPYVCKVMRGWPLACTVALMAARLLKGLGHAAYSVHSGIVGSCCCAMSPLQAGRQACCLSQAALPPPTCMLA